MKEITFTEFRKDASALLYQVEDGEMLRVTRHGRAIADVTPCYQVEPAVMSWQQNRVKKYIPGASLADVILHERHAS